MDIRHKYGGGAILAGAVVSQHGNIFDSCTLVESSQQNFLTRFGNYHESPHHYVWREMHLSRRKICGVFWMDFSSQKWCLQKAINCYIPLSNILNTSYSSLLTVSQPGYECQLNSQKIFLRSIRCLHRRCKSRGKWRLITFSWQVFCRKAEKEGRHTLWVRKRVSKTDRHKGDTANARHRETEGMRDAGTKRQIMFETDAKQTKNDMEMEKYLNKIDVKWQTDM